MRIFERREGKSGEPERREWVRADAEERFAVEVGRQFKDTGVESGRRVRRRAAEKRGYRRREATG